MKIGTVIEARDIQVDDEILCDGVWRVVTDSCCNFDGEMDVWFGSTEDSYDLRLPERATILVQRNKWSLV